MTLRIGSKLGAYEILDLIGVGGMGEVYRARDTRLPRHVAIKVSREKFTERFAREARVIASLNHPNITTLYDVGPHFLVMELVEGPTLGDRLRQGPLPLDEASQIARQITDALDYAHERGVVHRDLKPANIKIRPDGVVKVLDFGLAKSAGAHAAPQADDVPTEAAPRTEAGMILGTAAYMSPEQVRGDEVDKRADIWAFGCVYYEMLAGSRLYERASPRETMASVLRDEPDLSNVPAQALRLLKHCLEKDPRKRLRHIGDAMLLLDDASAAKPAPAPTQAVRFEVGPSGTMTFNTGGAATVSPDGRWLVFPASGEDRVPRFWIRSLDTVDARPLPGTETHDILPPASWSWDSRYIIFAANGKLQKVEIQRGPPQTLADWGFMNGAAWNRDDIILVARGPDKNGPLCRLLASGGGPSPVTALDKDEISHRWPQFLPDGRRFLYQRVFADEKRMGVYVGSIDVEPEDQSRQRLLAGNTQAYYAALPGGHTGHLVFLRETTLMAQPFDPITLKLSGEPTPIADGVDSAPVASHGQFSVSDMGTLVFRGGASRLLLPTWFDEHGNPEGTLGDAGQFANPAVSPDGTRLAVALGAEPNRDIWILDERGRSTRFTSDRANNSHPVWSPDGKNVVFRSSRSGPGDLFVKPADGGLERVLVKSAELKRPTDWSRSKTGSFLLFESQGSTTAASLCALSMEGDSKPMPLTQGPSEESGGRLAPDGRWIAYTSRESDTYEIYVRPFLPRTSAAMAGAKWTISGGGGLHPRWRKDGKALFYVSLDFQLMSVDVETSRGFKAGTPRRLFAVPRTVIQVAWSLTPDGKHFLFLAPPGEDRPVPFTVVVNWAETLKRQTA